MKLIGLAGYARCGKDTACTAMGWTRAAFADALKADLAPLLPNAEKSIIRPVLVEYGRAWRAVDRDYWIKRLVLPNAEHVALADVRYSNEARWIIGRGGLVVRIERPGYGPANTEEVNSFAELEREFPEIRTVWNDAGPEELAAKVLGLAREHFGFPCSAASSCAP